MATFTDRFFAGLFDEKDFVNLTKKTTISSMVSGTSWLGSFFFPGKTGELCQMKSASLTMAVFAGCISVFFAIKRDKPLRKKRVLVAIEDNNFVDRSGVITGLNAEETAQHLEECLRKTTKTGG